MDTALIDHGSGVTRSVSEIPLLVGSISRGPSSLSLPPPEPAAASNPSRGSGGGGGGDGRNGNGSADPATDVWTTRLSASPPRPPVPPAATTAPISSEEDVSKLDLAIMACSIGLVVPVAVNIKDLTSSWETPWKVLYGVLMILSLASTVTGFFFTAWGPAASWGRRLSPTCARFGLVDAAALFIVFLSCKLGRLGCAAGIASAALVALVLGVVWAWSERRPARTGGADQAAAAVQGGAGLLHDMP